MINKLFVYGTLLYPALFEAVSGLKAACEPARLPGYRRLQVTGKDYPGIIVDPNASVDGLIYHGLNKSALRKLDRYEDSFYQRSIAIALTGDNRKQKVWIYRINVSGQSRLASHDWDVREFERHVLAQYLKRYGR